MVIKRMSLCGLLSFALVGCSMSSSDVDLYQKSNNFELKKHKAANGERLSVQDLRVRYRGVTGLDLPEVSTESCKTDDVCYYDAYARTYDALMVKERNKKAEEQKVYDAACQADEECSQKKIAGQLTQRLRQEYGFLLSSNPYAQSDTDMIFRTVCDAAEKHYKSGASKDSFINNLKDAPGLGPQARYQLLEIASTCWDATKAGVSWNVAIR